MTIMRIAMPKAQALPSTVDERRAKSRKASLTTQKKSRDCSCCLSFSFCVSIAIISFPSRSSCGSSGLPSSSALTTENETQHETDSERGEDCLRRILSDVLFTIVLKTAPAMKCVIQYFFPALPIFIGHCACG